MVNHVNHYQNMSWVCTHMMFKYMHSSTHHECYEVLNARCQTSNTLLECQSFIRGGGRTSCPASLVRLQRWSSARVWGRSRNYKWSHTYSCQQAWTIPRSRTLKSSATFAPLLCTQPMDVLVRHPWSRGPDGVRASCQIDVVAHLNATDPSVCSQPSRHIIIQPPSG